jgi:hypothetical protein
MFLVWTWIPCQCFSQFVKIQHQLPKKSTFNIRCIPLKICKNALSARLIRILSPSAFGEVSKNFSGNPAFSYA